MEKRKEEVKEKEEEEDERKMELVAPNEPSYSADRTILADPNNFTIKHPLQHRWTLWYDNAAKKYSTQSWGEQLKQIVTFDTVEDFWRVFNNIRPASKLSIGSNYHLFKENVEPKWEHPVNTKGGKWVYSVPKGKKEIIDKLWLYCLLACIGENFPEEEEVCGAVVSLRRAQHRLALWTRTAVNEPAQRALGESFKKILEVQDKDALGYQVHADSLEKSSSFATTYRYQV